MTAYISRHNLTIHGVSYHHFKVKVFQLKKCDGGFSLWDLRRVTMTFVRK